MNGRSTVRRRVGRVFVVRLWRDAGAPIDAVRCSVEEVGGAERHAFADLAGLPEYLRRSLDGSKSRG